MGDEWRQGDRHGGGDPEDAMYRFVPALTLSIVALAAAAPVLAADYPEGFRPSYPEDYDSYQPLGFEAGLRYWYSWGQQTGTFGSTSLDSKDNTSILEGHLRIDDYTTQSYVKGLAGYSVAINGDYTIGGTSGSIDGGRVGYAGADFGWSPFGWAPGGNGVYGLVGYQYWNDSPETGRGPFVVSVNNAGNPTAFDSAVNNLDIHALRLGLSGRADFGTFDVTAEVAAIPYAWMTGTLGTGSTSAFTVAGSPLSYYQSSPTSVSGTGYGAMGEVMVGFKPIENLAIRAGARAWYVGGNLDYTYSAIPSNDPSASQGFIGKTWVSAFRYGLLGELTYKF